MRSLVSSYGRDECIYKRLEPFFALLQFLHFPLMSSTAHLSFYPDVQTFQSLITTGKFASNALLCISFPPILFVTFWTVRGGKGKLHFVLFSNLILSRLQSGKKS